MRIDAIMGSIEAVRRKLRAVTAVAGDAGATEHEKANAAALKTRLEQQLREAGAPAGRLDGRPFSARQADNGAE